MGVENALHDQRSYSEMIYAFSVCVHIGVSEYYPSSGCTTQGSSWLWRGSISGGKQGKTKVGNLVAKNDAMIGGT